MFRWNEEQGSSSKIGAKDWNTKRRRPDQVDRVVTEIIENMRNGENVRLPGLGTFVAGEKPRFRFERKPDATD